MHKHHGISLKSPFCLHLFLSALQKWENGLWKGEEPFLDVWILTYPPSQSKTGCSEKHALLNLWNCNELSIKLFSTCGWPGWHNWLSGGEEHDTIIMNYNSIWQSNVACDWYIPSVINIHPMSIGLYVNLHSFFKLKSKYQGHSLKNYMLWYTKHWCLFGLGSCPLVHGRLIMLVWKKKNHPLFRLDQ